MARIGDRNIFAEGVTVHRGTAAGSETVIGNDCFFMANSHAAHNCIVQDHVILANGAMLGGHSTVGERAFISGNVAVHQNVRVGRLSMLSGVGSFTVDVPPFALVSDRNRLRGMNSVGVRRAGISRDAVQGLRGAFRDLFQRRGNLTMAREELVAGGGLGPEVLELLEFIENSVRGVCRMS
jgi:UDP-N-acetylglucosamine acyltransferase